MKNVRIDELLTWAYTQELWKVGSGGGASAVAGSSWSMVANVGALGTLIDKTPNEYGLIPGYEAEEPHPDAVAVGLAVKALPDFPIPEWFEFFPDWADPNGTVAAAVDAELVVWGRKSTDQRRQHISNTVASCAILSRAPDWKADHPGDVMVSKNGKPAWFVVVSKRDALGNKFEQEVDGYNKKAERPFQGAYRKWRLKEPIRSTVQDRLDWFLYQSSLLHLSSVLRPCLANHLIRDFTPDMMPFASDMVGIDAA